MVIRYFIRNTDNSGRRGILGVEFKTRPEAQAYIDRLLAPGRVNPGGQRQTAYRDAISGTGINNPRIIRREVFR